MPSALRERVRFVVNRLRERLWVRPLAISLLSCAVVYVAELADKSGLQELVPDVTSDSVTTLLSIMASSMLVIATFAVASMLSAYNSAGMTGTPRSFALVVADDISQNALASFIGSFIFSVVALTAIKNGFVEKGGLFVVFVLTVFVFAVVILTFVRWVDRIARLGRVGESIAKVESATAEAVSKRRRAPALLGIPVSDDRPEGKPLYADRIGYVQHIDMPRLQSIAEEVDGQIRISAIPGTLVAPGRPVAYIRGAETEDEQVAGAFTIGHNRVFDDDPRFGFIALSEIAGRALSPGVNDPGTAIQVIGSFVRLLSAWKASGNGKAKPCYDRVEVPLITVDELFDDAFTSIATYGAGSLEVSIRLQKALLSLASVDGETRYAAAACSRRLMQLVEKNMQLDQDIAAVRRIADRFSG